ncbi:MAG: response regulator [Spirochaetales bacterium]|nr:response regulator [Spirochaetales bacterium]
MNSFKSHITILVVDDDPLINNLLKNSITNIGYNCYTALDAEQALTILEKHDIDVMIADIVLPRKSGLELAKITRKKYNCDIMVMTGFEKGIKYEDVIEQGAKDFIRKPLSPEEVMVRLNRILDERKIIFLQKQTEQKLKTNIDRLKRLVEATVNALASALEKRDPYTSGHQKRVATIACKIAERMNLSQIKIDGIRLAGLLHDIGKISIPVDILIKPSKLDAMEYEIIKQHPQIGYEIIKDIEFERPISQIVIQHHERLNGSGYPSHLKSEDIIQEAKILAVADVVEAMTSHRPYRVSLGVEKAIAEIDSNRGVLYDAPIVDACIDFIKNAGMP